MSVDKAIIYCLGYTLLLIGGVLLTTLTSELFPPYNYAKDFKHSNNCTVISNAFSGNACCEASVRQINNCDKDYIYPCLKVHTVYGGTRVLR